MLNWLILRFKFRVETNGIQRIYYLILLNIAHAAVIC